MLAPEVCATVTTEVDTYLHTIKNVTCKEPLVYERISSCTAIYLIRSCFNRQLHFDFTVHFDHCNPARFDILERALIKALVRDVTSLDKTHACWPNTLVALWPTVKPNLHIVENLLIGFLDQPARPKEEFAKIFFYYTLLGQQEENPTENRGKVIAKLAISVHARYVAYGEHHMKYFSMLDALDDLCLIDRPRTLRLVRLTRISNHGLGDPSIVMTRYYLAHHNPSFRNLLYKLYHEDFKVRLLLFNEWFMQDIAWLLLYQFVGTVVK